MTGASPSHGRIARRAIVRGRVQGVFFRDSVRRLASSRGVAGWARNRPDGSVEVWLEGAADAVAELLEFCRRGPARAHVEELAVEEAEPQGLEGFRVG